MAALVALIPVLLIAAVVANSTGEAAKNTNQTESGSYTIINGTRYDTPVPETTAKLDVVIREMNPPAWPFQVYVENHPVGFDIIVKNPTSKKYLVDVEGQLWYPNPRDAGVMKNQPDKFKHTAMLLEPGGSDSYKYWTQQLLPGGYVLNVSAFQVYAVTNMPNGAISTSYNASGQAGLSFVVYSEDSRNNLYIALGTIGAAVVALGAVVAQSLLSRSTLKEMKNQSTTSQRQVKLMADQLNLERRKKHYERLIEDSIRRWRYEPASSSEMIHVYERTQLGSIEKPVKYLEQTKKHLEGYPAIWQLYKDAPALVKRKEELRVEYEQIRRTVVEELAKELSVRDLKHIIDIPDVSQLFGEKTWNWYRNRYDNVKRVFALVPKERDGDKDNVFLDDRIFSTIHAEIIVPAVNALLANEDLYGKYQNVLKELMETESKIESNRASFQSSVEKEVTDKVTVSGYEEMLGKCDQCPKEI